MWIKNFHKKMIQTNHMRTKQKKKKREIITSTGALQREDQKDHLLYYIKL